MHVWTLLNICDAENCISDAVTMMWPCRFVEPRQKKMEKQLPVNSSRISYPTKLCVAIQTSSPIQTLLSEYPESKLFADESLDGFYACYLNCQTALLITLRLWFRLDLLVNCLPSVVMFSMQIDLNLCFVGFSLSCALENVVN